MVNLLTEGLNVPYLVTQYVVYGAIFIVGLIVLLIMKRISKKPVTATAILQTKKSIARVDALLGNGEKKVNDYMFPAKIMQLSSAVGDLVLLADKEFTANKNIAYEGVLGAYIAAGKRLDEIAVTWNRETATEPLTGVKNDLERALKILEQIANPRKK